MASHNQPTYAHRAKLLISENNQISERLLEGRQEWKIGRYAPTSPYEPDIILTNRFVARQQGSIREIDGEWFYIESPLSTNSATHNGTIIPRPSKRKPQAVPLKDGDTIRIGSDDNSVCLVFKTAID